MSFQGKAAECTLTTVRDGKMEIPPYLLGLSLEGRVLSRMLEAVIPGKVRNQTWF
jgi:hypothetical protein